MSKTQSNIRIAKSILLNKYCLKNSNNERITPWFDSYDEHIVGDFVKLVTNVGTFVYNNSKTSLLYEDTRGKEIADIYKLTDEVYYIKISFDDSISLVQLYYANGEAILFPAFEDVCTLKNGMIAVKELMGAWGVLNKELAWKITPMYSDLLDFNSYGYAAGYLEESNSTDLFRIDEHGEIEAINIKGYYSYQLTDEFVVVTQDKKYGVVNINGQSILPIEYDSIVLYLDHFILKANGKYGLADRTGKVIKECNCYKIISEGNKFVAVTRKIVETKVEIVV